MYENFAKSVKQSILKWYIKNISKIYKGEVL